MNRRAFLKSIGVAVAGIGLLGSVEGQVVRPVVKMDKAWTQHPAYCILNDNVIHSLITTEYRVIHASRPLTEGKVPPIVAEAKKEADRIGGKVVCMSNTAAVVRTG